MHPHQPSISEKLFFFFSGALISTPFPALFNSLASYFLVLNLPVNIAIVISIAVVAPILEEFAKAYPLFYRHGETKRSIFTLGFLTGLGFGIAEFLLYVFIFQAPPLIRFPLIFFHAASTSIIAFGIGRKKAFPFYLLAVVLHSLNNLASFFGFWLIGGTFSVLFSIVLAIFLYRKTSENLGVIGSEIG